MSVTTWGPVPEEPVPEGEGPELALMLHCTFAQGSAWAGVARHLAGRISMIAPDLLGHGAGPVPDPGQDFHDQATFEAARHLPEAPCHLVGHSFGATLALRLALDHRDRVKTLTLIEPVLFCAANGPGRAAHDAHLSGMPAALAAGDRRAAARMFMGLWGAQPFDASPPALQRYITDRIWIPDACAPALVEDRAGILPRLAGLHLPTLLLQGAKSPTVIAEILCHLQHVLPNATSHTIPNAAHMAPITNASATAHALTAFLNLP